MGRLEIVDTEVRDNTETEVSPPHEEPESVRVAMALFGAIASDIIPGSFGSSLSPGSGRRHVLGR